MRIRRLGVLAAATFLVALTAPASADILVHVDKTLQRMTVSVDGVPRYVWPVSTGGPHYDTPSGTFNGQGP
jgi:lipoprotein-anchoring transpeptidase ErfK/SrfK